MKQLIKRTWAEVDLDALSYNYDMFKKHINKTAEIMAIVKSDAYGHGVGYVARKLSEKGATWFGVADLDEALQLRHEGIKEPILILGYTSVTATKTLIENNFTQTVFDIDYASQLNEKANKFEKKLDVHVKVDTGMSRIGLYCQHSKDIEKCVGDIIKIKDMENLICDGLFTHFACADEEDREAITLNQFSQFKCLISKLKQEGINFNIKHCCNTAAAMRFKEMHMDIVRVGIGLYGFYPASWLKTIMNLKPAMELKSVVSMVKTVPEGTSVSYNLTYTTDKESVIATIPIGYADGFSRMMGNEANILVRGHLAPVIGTVCMDQSLVDVTGIENVKLGMTVTIFGKEDDNVLPVEELAKLMHSINYEVICLIGKRVPRVYFENGEQIGIINYILTKNGL